MCVCVCVSFNYFALVDDDVFYLFLQKQKIFESLLFDRCSRRSTRE
jgi:hypothetical protein